MNNKEIEIENNIVCYEEEFGLNHNQVVLSNICLKQGYFQPDTVESILNIFLFETFKEDECYHDGTNFINEEYLTKNPQIIEQMIKDYENYY